MINDEQPTWDKLIQYFRGELSDVEKDEVEAWRSQSPFNRRVFDEFSRVWKALEMARSSGRFPSGKSWHRFSRWYDRQQQIERMRRTRQRWLVFSRYAAAVVVAALITWGVPRVLESSRELSPLVVEVPNSQRSTITLFDGSTVTLNSGSQLEYLPGFKKERRVKLNGEAWFSVTKDASHPFLVETKDFTVKVLGTEFNVKNYASDEWAETSLLEGSVELIFPQTKNLTLKTGERVRVNRSGKGNLEKIEHPDRITAWREGKYYFEGETLFGISQILERAFDVKIVFEDEHMKNEKYTGSLDVDEHVRDVMHRLALTSSFPLNYEIEGDKVLLFSER